jgi:hypothetical protein
MEKVVVKSSRAICVVATYEVKGIPRKEKTLYTVSVTAVNETYSVFTVTKINLKGRDEHLGDYSFKAGDRQSYAAIIDVLLSPEIEKYIYWFDIKNGFRQDAEMMGTYKNWIGERMKAA